MGPSFAVVFSLLLVALLVHSCDHTVLAVQGHRHPALTFFFLLCIMRSVWILVQPFVSFTCRFCFPPRGVWESVTVEFAFRFADLQNQSNGETSKIICFSASGVFNYQWTPLSSYYASEKNGHVFLGN